MRTVNDVLVDPYPFYRNKRVWINQNKKGYGSTNTWSWMLDHAVCYLTLLIPEIFSETILHFFHQWKSKIINLPPFCARPLIYRLNLGLKPIIKCVNHLHSSVLKTTIHTWPQVGSSWLLAPVLSSSLHHGHDIQCTSKYRTVGRSENQVGQSLKEKVFFLYRPKSVDGERLTHMLTPCSN